MCEIPIFPLPLVLFPGGRVPLQIFEPRYLDMVKRCLQKNSGFGIVMHLARTEKNRTPSKPQTISRCGTCCTIVDFDQLPSGMLGIIVEGQAKFVVRNSYKQKDGLILANVDFLALEDEAPVPEQHEHLSELLMSLMEHEAVRRLGLQCDLRQATEVGARLTELLPCPNHFKQRLLEMKDPLMRLRELEKLVGRMC